MNQDQIDIRRKYAIPGFEDVSLNISEWMTGNNSQDTECIRCGLNTMMYAHNEGEDRFYRACKVCGFWQDVDGGPPYECVLKGHLCPGGKMYGQFFMPWEVENNCPKCYRLLIPLLTHWQQVNIKL